VHLEESDDVHMQVAKVLSAAPPHLLPKSFLFDVPDVSCSTCRAPATFRLNTIGSSGNRRTAVPIQHLLR
jgi:hypothetical protein